MNKTLKIALSVILTLAISISLFVNLPFKAKANSLYKTEASVAKSYSGIFNAIARQPEMIEELLKAKNKLSSVIKNLTSEEVLIAREEVLGDLYENAVRQPELIEKLVEIFIELLRERPKSPSIRVQAAAARSYIKLYSSIARQPEMMNTLFETRKKLSSEVVALDSDEIKIAREEVIGSLYLAIHRQPEIEKDLIKSFTELLGKKTNNPSIKVQAASAKNLSNLFFSISRSPALQNTLLKIRDEQSVGIKNLDAKEVQIARGEVLSRLLEILSKRLNNKDMLVNLFEDYLGQEFKDKSVDVQATNVRSIGYLIKGIIKHPDKKDSLMDVMKKLSFKNIDLSNEKVQVARVEALSYLYDELRDNKTEVSKLFVKFLGEKPKNASIAVQEAVANGYPRLLESISGNLDKKQELIEAMNNLLPPITDTSNKKIEGAKASIYGYLLSAINNKEQILDLIKTLNLKVNNLGLEEVQIGRYRSLSKLYSPIYSRDNKEIYVKIFTDNLGEQIDINHYIVTIDEKNETPIKTKTVYSGKTMPKPSNPSKLGMNFLGWFEDAKEFDFSKPITKNTTIIARWKNRENYPVLEGDNQVISFGEEKSVKFKIEAPISEFVNLELDDKMVCSSAYSLAKGSVILNLNASYVKNIPVGTHKLTTHFDKGSATLHLVVKEKKKPDIKPDPKPSEEKIIPDTGFEGRLGFYIIVSLISFSITAGLAWKVDKNYNA